MIYMVDLVIVIIVVIYIVIVIVMVMGEMIWVMVIDYYADL